MTRNYLDWIQVQEEKHNYKQLQFASSATSCFSSLPLKLPNDKDGITRSFVVEKRGQMKNKCGNDTKIFTFTPDVSEQRNSWNKATFPRGRHWMTGWTRRSTNFPANLGRGAVCVLSKNNRGFIVSPHTSVCLLSKPESLQDFTLFFIIIIIQDCCDPKRCTGAFPACILLNLAAPSAKKNKNAETSVTAGLLVPAAAAPQYTCCCLQTGFCLMKTD